MSNLLAILGPTGAGKSELALVVAERFGGEIVNFDSIQVYRHFDIGAAKLAAEEQRGIPHHLIDLLEPNEVFTAGEFARRATRAVREIAWRSRLPILAGGTGFYLRALLDGLFPGPARNEGLRQRLARRPPERLHRLLRRLDPAASQKIHPHDVPKMIRALEVTVLARQPITALFQQGRQRLEGFTVLKLGLWPERDALYDRINRRTEAMFASGLVDETRRILEQGWAPESKPFESHGYRQAVQHLQGELNRREAIFYAQRNTRRYAKRQLTWFRREADVVWLRGFGDEPQVQQEAVERVAGWLAGAGERPTL
jgi:tRNA dimethylallyltransferase